MNERGWGGEAGTRIGGFHGSWQEKVENRRKSLQVSPHIITISRLGARATLANSREVVFLKRASRF